MSMNIKSRLHRLHDQLNEWFDVTEALVEDLEALATNLDDHFSNISKAKVGGSTAAVAGGLLSAAGFGLSFVTFGASLGLVVAGGLIGGAGGLVVAGSQITDAVLAKNRKYSADEILQKYKSRIESMMKECIEIGTLLQDHGDVDTYFPEWVSFWSKIVMNSGNGIKKAAWDIIGRTVTSYLKLSVKADQVVQSGGTAAATAFKTIGSTAGKSLHVAGGLLGMVVLPFDIYTLVDSSIDVHKGNPHETSNKIREMVAQIKTGRPTKAEIDKMVRETVSSFGSLSQRR